MVCAVIVNYNAGDHLLACVRSLRAEGVAEVVVVDNESRDGSGEALARSDPAATFVPMGANFGFGTAANRGVALTSAPYVLVMNPDTVVGPGMVDALAAALDRDPALAAVGPRIDNPDGSRYPSARRFPSVAQSAGHGFLGLVWPANRFSRAYKMDDTGLAEARLVDWISGACLMVRRPAFDQVGGFDESYFMYCEDVDLCWRMSRAGWGVGYEPGGRVVHVVGVSSNQAPYRMILAHHVSMWRFAAKTTTGVSRAALPAVGVALGLRLVAAWLQRRWRGHPPRS